MVMECGECPLLLLPKDFRSKERFPKLPADVLSLDFSGWPIYTHASVPDDIACAFCVALEERKAHIPWGGPGPLPLETRCRDSAEGPLDIPLHPGADEFWKQRGYIAS
jgi:hypothetical protein